MRGANSTETRRGNDREWRENAQTAFACAVTAACAFSRGLLRFAGVIEAAKNFFKKFSKTFQNFSKIKNTKDIVIFSR